MDQTKRPIVKVEAIGPAINTKTSFCAPVRYTLADGTTVKSVFATRRKRDVLPGIADMNLRAERGDIAALFHDDKFVAIQIAYGIGIR